MAKFMASMRNSFSLYAFNALYGSLSRSSFTKRYNKVWDTHVKQIQNTIQLLTRKLLNSLAYKVALQTSAHVTC